MASPQPTSPDEPPLEGAIDWEHQRSTGERQIGCGATVFTALASAFGTMAIVAGTDGVAADDLDAGNSAAMTGLWFMLSIGLVAMGTTIFWVARAVSGRIGLALALSVLPALVAPIVVPIAWNR